MAFIMCIVESEHGVIVHHGECTVIVLVVLVAAQVAVKEGRKGRMGSSGGTVLR